MTPIVSIAVTAHPSRATMADALMAQLPPSAQLFMDPFSKGPWPNVRRAWLEPAPWATHRLVLEEDVELCPDFVEVATKAIAARPNDIIDFFAIRPGMTEAREAGVNWVSYGARCWGPAMAMPIQMGHDMVAWSERHCRDDLTAGDMRILIYAAHLGHRIYCTAPSLVQHRADAPLIDASKEANAIRQSPWVAGDEAKNIDWNGPALDLPGLWRIAGIRRKYLRNYP